MGTVIPHAREQAQPDHPHLGGSALRSIADQLWTAEASQRTGPLELGARMTVVRLPEGGLWLHSPIPIDDHLAEALAPLGPVRDIVAPNAFHHLYLTEAARRYPEARIHVSAALAARRPQAGQYPVLDGTLPAEWAPDLRQLPIAGMPQLQEHVFLHRPSRTLIVTDLIFNMQQTHGLLTPLVLRVMGTYKRPAVSRLIHWYVRDLDAVRDSLRSILEWDFDRVIMAHGDILEGRARLILEHALARYL